MEFVLGGFSACCAGFFSNPMDVIKTRQQLQGELVAKSNLSKEKMPYTTIRQAIVNIVKADGIWGLQKGLSSALAFQFVMNSIRLGSYQTFDNKGFNKNSKGELVPILCVFWGGTAGVLGATAGCPLYMVKTQIQAQSKGEYAVGYQHKHSSTFNALVTVAKKNGVRGLWRGCTGIIIRTAAGSSAQLSTFSNCKSFLVKYEPFQNSLFLTAVFSSIISGFIACVVMTPFDTVATRLFNQGIDSQGKPLLYRNVLDCFLKTFKVEGMLGLYKGFLPNYFRLAPHTILNLTFWEHFKKWKNLYYDKNEM